MKTQLLCTFAHKSDIFLVVDYIKSTYILPENKIFVFANLNNQDELFCTYNIEAKEIKGKNTILIHRKKETNTIYTVNALNNLIMKINGNILDKTFPIEWPKYENTLLLSLDSDVREIKLTLYSIIRIN